MKKKFYCDVWGPVTEGTYMSPMTWPPPSDAPSSATRYVFEVEFPEAEGVELPASPAERVAP